MRIVHIAQSIAGGIASYLEEIAGFQTQLYGIDAVRFLVPAMNRHYIPSVRAEQIVEFCPSDRSLRGFLALGVAAYREIRRFRPTIVHLHSTYAGAVVRPILKLSGQGTKVVYCPHGWAFGMEIPMWKHILYATIERNLAPLTDIIINISHWEYRLACANGIDATRMVTIRNGIGEHPPESSSTLGQFQAPGFHLIFVGRHDRQKGLDRLLTLFKAAAAPGVHLHVVGSPIVDAGGAADNIANVTFYGWRPRAVVSEMIASSDALVMPSRWEGFGLAALEAMRLGKPVIASRRGALTEIIEDGKTGYHFDLDSASELHDILYHLRKDELSSMGLRAQQEFLRSFSASRLNEELAGLYETLDDRKVHEHSGRWK